MSNAVQTKTPHTAAGEIFPLLAKLRSVAADLNEAASALIVLHAQARVSETAPAEICMPVADIADTLADLADHIQWVRDGIKGIDARL